MRSHAIWKRRHQLSATVIHAERGLPCSEPTPNKTIAFSFYIEFSYCCRIPLIEISRKLFRVQLTYLDQWRKTRARGDLSILSNWAYRDQFHTSLNCCIEITSKCNCACSRSPTCSTKTIDHKVYWNYTCQYDSNYHENPENLNESRSYAQK